MYVCFAFFSVFIAAVTRFQAYEACVCIAANCHCGSGSGDPHVTSMLDKRTVTCGCAGEQTYVDNPYVNVKAVNTRINPTSDVTVYTEVSEQMDSNKAPVLSWFWKSWFLLHPLDFCFPIWVH